MEAMIIWLHLHAWTVEAACDVVTVACCTSVVLLIARRPQAAPLLLPRMVRGPEIKAAPSEAEPERVKAQTKVAANEPFVSPAKRRLVNDALEAMGRWEATYRPGRGLDDLATFTRNSRIAMKEPAESR
jgi:hypothetical protein